MMMLNNSPALTFRLGDQHYAIALDEVVEVSAMLELIRIVDAPPEVLGMANRHGELILVIDLRQLFGMPALAVGLNTLFIVVKYEATLLGVVVDDIQRVDYLPIKQLQQTSTWGKYIEGIISYQAQTIQFIAVPAVIARYSSTFSKAE